LALGRTLSFTSSAGAPSAYRSLEERREVFAQLALGEKLWRGVAGRVIGEPEI
jgi:hypothetical protein